MVITLGGGILGLLYPVFADDYDTLLPFFNGFAIGVPGGATLAVFEKYLLKPGQRRFSFPTLVGIRIVLYTLLYSALIIIVKGFNESIYYDQPLLAYIKGEQFTGFLVHGDFRIILVYMLTMSGLIIFTQYMSRKLGQGVLYNFITGRYHTPKEEHRIFMFIDIRSSTTIAEKLGPFRYYQLLNDFFFDITGSIIRGRGMIYRYVGDQVTITWRLRSKSDNTNCIRTYFLIKATFQKLRERYFVSYGLVPEFRASLHCGKVIRGEIGDIKSQIVFHGEPLYETAQMEKICGDLGLPVIISGPLKEQILPSSLMNFEKVSPPSSGRTHLAFDLYTVKQKAI